MACLKFELEGIPLAANKLLRMHYHKRNAYFKGWYRYVALATSKIRPQHPFKHARIKIAACYGANRFKDYDGLVTSLKPIVDGLVHCNILVDDSWAVTGPWLVSQVLDKSAKKGRIEIEIQDMTDTLIGTLNPGITIQNNSKGEG